MSHKYTILAVAYRNVDPETLKTIHRHSVRKIDEVSDLNDFCAYGRQFDQDSRVAIYLDWYESDILKYLEKGYEVALLELPYSGHGPIVEAFEALDIELGDDVLIIEHDEV